MNEVDKSAIEAYKAGHAYGQAVGILLTIESLLITIKQQKIPSVDAVLALLELIRKDAQKEFERLRAERGQP